MRVLFCIFGKIYILRSIFLIPKLWQRKKRKQSPTSSSRPSSIKSADRSARMISTLDFSRIVSSSSEMRSTLPSRIRSSLSFSSSRKKTRSHRSHSTWTLLVDMSLLDSRSTIRCSISSLTSSQSVSDSRRRWDRSSSPVGQKENATHWNTLRSWSISLSAGSNDRRSISRSLQSISCGLGKFSIKSSLITQVSRSRKSGKTAIEIMRWLQRKHWNTDWSIRFYSSFIS